MWWLVVGGQEKKNNSVSIVPKGMHPLEPFANIEKKETRVKEEG